MPQPGLFITFEGAEGAGKSTQVRLAATALRAAGHDVLETREPGGTPLGEELRRVLKHFGRPGDVCAESEALLFGASRAQLMRAVLLPHLEKGGTVVCDRFADSTTVYQGVGRKLPPDFLEAMHEFCLAGRWPDFTFLLDVDSAHGLNRAASRDNGKADRIERECATFHERVRHGFLALAERHGGRFTVLDGTHAPEAIHAEVMERLNRGVC